MGKKHFCSFQTAETGNRTPNSGVKGSGANHYPRGSAQKPRPRSVDDELLFELSDDYRVDYTPYSAKCHDTDDSGHHAQSKGECDVVTLME